MKRIYAISIFLLVVSVFYTGCKGNAKISTTTSYQYVSVVVNKQYTQGEEVEVLLKNTSSDQLMLHKPMQNKIEYKEADDKWTPVHIRYCPCGASCPPPPETLEFPVSATHSFKWDQSDTQCNGMETTKTQVQKGTYRAVFAYSMPGSRDLTTVYAEFEIK